MLLISNNHVILVGKPYFENIQYNSPIEIYDDNTVDEMVKIMNNPGTDIGLKTEARPAHPVPLNNGFNNGFDQPRTNELSAKRFKKSSNQKMKTLATFL